MRLTILGSTGATGRELVRQGLNAGHEVVALARRPEDVDQSHPRLRVVGGDVAEPESISDAIRGADAVVSALGSHSGRGATDVYSAGAAAVISAMKSSGGARRLLAVSAAPVAPAGDKGAFDRLLLHRVIAQFFGGLYDDMQRMEDLIRSSDTDWTIFRPPRLTDRPMTGRYRIAVDVRLQRAFSIGRADLAAAMLDAIDDPRLVGHAVQIAG